MRVTWSWLISGSKSELHCVLSRGCVGADWIKPDLSIKLWFRKCWRQRNLLLSSNRMRRFYYRPGILWYVFVPLCNVYLNHLFPAGYLGMIDERLVPWIWTLLDSLTGHLDFWKVNEFSLAYLPNTLCAYSVRSYKRRIYAVSACATAAEGIHNRMTFQAQDPYMKINVCHLLRSLDAWVQTWRLSCWCLLEAGYRLRCLNLSII